VGQPPCGTCLLYPNAAAHGSGLDADPHLPAISVGETEVKIYCIARVGESEARASAESANTKTSQRERHGDAG